MATDLAFELSAFVAVVVIDIDVRCITEGADCKRGDFWRVSPLLNRFERFAVISLILSQKELIVLGRWQGLFK